MKVAILGAGVMGQGIAHTVAVSGFETVLYDIDPEALDRALDAISTNLQKGVDRGKLTSDEKEAALGQIGTSSKVNTLDPDLIIEAIVEDLETKHTLLKEMQELYPEAIVASNTSTLPITQIAAKLPIPGNVVGMHFFNPAYLMKLVEVVRGTATTDSTFNLASQFVKQLGKTGVAVQDSPGFIVNRVARPYYTESLKVLEDGSEDIEGIDQLLESTGFRMGPFRLMDLIGVDTNFAVTTNMFEQFFGEARFKPSRKQQQLVDSGQHGKKSGKGFYSYTD